MSRTGADGASGLGEGAQPLVVAVALDTDERVDPRWGRAERVALVKVAQGLVSDWDVCEVGWDVAHDEGSERAHHARVARFVKQHAVNVVVAHHMGGDMRAMLERMGVEVHLGAAGEARRAVLEAVGSALTGGGVPDR